MSTTRRTLGVGALLLVGLVAMPSSVSAQFTFQPGIQPLNPTGPSFLTTPGMTLNQYLAMSQVQARTAAQLLASPYSANFANPYAPATSPYSNPYSPVGDPYSGMNPYNPMNSGYYPYYYQSPYGATLQGQADVMRAYGQLITNQEQARIMREQAMQAKLDTQKKRFDLEAYIKANTPTFTEEQSKIARQTLKRLQTNSNPYEVVNGKALNYLLDDVRKFPGRKVSMDSLPLGEDLLKQLNITKSAGGLGLLRDDGKFTWPVALQELLSPEQQKAIEAQAQLLVKNAQKGNLDVNVLKDLRVELDRIRETLTKKTLEIPTSQYLDAKRFLSDFDDARVALEKGEAITNLDFQKWAKGGKDGRTVGELARYMSERGLKFAPATSNDEASYRALYSALAALDVALNTQAPSGDEKEN